MVPATKMERYDQSAKERELARIRDAMNDGASDGGDEEVDIMWPSATRQTRPEQPQLEQHSKSISGEGRSHLQQQEPSSSGIDWVSKANRANNRHSIEEDEADFHTGMRTDFNFSKEDNSGSYDRDVRK